MRSILNLNLTLNHNPLSFLSFVICLIVKYPQPLVSVCRRSDWLSNRIKIKSKIKIKIKIKNRVEIFPECQT